MRSDIMWCDSIWCEMMIWRKHIVDPNRWLPPVLCATLYTLNLCSCAPRYTYTHPTERFVTSSLTLAGQVIDFKRKLQFSPIRFPGHTKRLLEFGRIGGRELHTTSICVYVRWVGG